MYKSLDTVYLNQVYKLLREAALPATDVPATPKKRGRPPGAPKPPPASYDSIIESVFPTPEEQDKLHKVVGVKMPASGTGEFHITNKNDKYVWDMLYEKGPYKKGSTVQTKGSGNAELALYWFLKQGNRGVTVSDNRDSKGSADLLIGNIGVEVKAYNPSDKEITIGRFREAGQFIGQNNNMVTNSILGINALMSKMSSFNESGEEKYKKQKILADNGNFKYDDFLVAFNKVDRLYKLIKSDSQLLAEFDLFSQLKDNIEEVYKILGNKPGENLYHSSEDNAKQLCFRILKAKLLDKPGPGGFIVNCTKDGLIQWMQVPVGLKEMKRYPEGFTGHEVFAVGSQLHVRKEFFK